LLKLFQLFFSFAASCLPEVMCSPLRMFSQTSLCLRAGSCKLPAVHSILKKAIGAALFPQGKQSVTVLHPLRWRCLVKESPVSMFSLPIRIFGFLADAKKAEGFVVKIEAWPYYMMRLIVLYYMMTLIVL
jgi:hypothetical protein